MNSYNTGHRMKWGTSDAFLRLFIVPSNVEYPAEQRARRCGVQSHGPLHVYMLLVLLLQTAITGSSLTNLTVLDVVHTKNSLFIPSVLAYRHGFLASLWKSNYTSGKVRLTVVHEDVNLNNIASKINEMATKSKDLIAVFGPASTSMLKKSFDTLHANNLVALGPISDESSVRLWRPDVYFFIGSTYDSVFTLLLHAVVRLRVKRVGYMFLEGVSYGEEELNFANSLMNFVERNISAVFKLNGRKHFSPSDAQFRKEWENFANARPQAIIVMGIPSETTKSFLQTVFEDSRTRATYLLLLRELQVLVLSVWKAAVKKGLPFLFRQVYTTGSNPMPNDFRYTCINRFQSEMSDYLTNSGQNTYTDHQLHLHDDTLGEMMVSGWMAGEVLLQTLAIYDPTNGREWYKGSLFAQRRYFIDDFVLGDYGGEIDPKAEAQGAISKCNQGGSVQFLKTFEEGFRVVTVEEGEWGMPLTVCYEKHKLYDPAFAIALNFLDLQGADYAQNEINVGLKAAVDRNARHLYAMKGLDTTLAKGADDLRREKEEFMVDIVLGVVTEEMLELPDLIFIDPIFMLTKPNRFSRNVLFFMPTMEQHLFVMSEYLATTDDPSAHVVAHGRQAEDFFDIVRRTFDTFHITLKSAVSVEPDKSLEQYLPTSGLTILIEVLSSDIEVLASHLERNKNSRLVMHFVTFAVCFMELTVYFKEKEIADRLLITTNLPHWGDPDSKSDIIRSYHEIFPDSDDWSPLSLNAFVVTKLMQKVFEGAHTIAASTIADYFYSRVVVSVDDMVYGPFSDGNSITCSSNADTESANCAKNYGASSIAVWSLTRVFDHTVPPLLARITPSMIYKVQGVQEMPTSKLILIIVGCILGILFLIVLAMTLICSCRDSRDNKSAPREVTDPVTLVFTDIESSTALWAACPEVMPDAVATHHRLIRRLIAKYHCYEVKTIGDSFMIACRSVFAAVQLVRELQQVFLLHDWGTTAIDDAYHALEERRAEEDEEYVPPTARLDPAVYRQYWKGLRVRAGVHTGLCDIRHDAVTKGYDYYGATSNTAARTESVANGGQVLLTRAAYMALSTVEREGVEVTALGAVALRGVPRPVEMYQLDAVPGRTFAALRLERQAIDVDGCTESCDQTVSSGSNNDSLSALENPFSSLLTELFNPLSLPQQQKMLDTLCQRWGVPVSFKKSNDMRDVCHGAICRLAAKLARVTARKAEIIGDERNVGFDTLIGSIVPNGSAHLGGSLVSFDTNSLPQPRNRMLSHHGSRLSAESESVTILCRPPPSLLPR